MLGQFGALRPGLSAMRRRKAAGGGSGTPWTPDMIGAPLVAWWDPSDTANMTMAAGAVQLWADKKGGVNFIENGSNKATWSATARNGSPGLTFVAANFPFYNISSATTFPGGDSISTLFIGAFCSNAAAGAAFFDYGVKTNLQHRSLMVGTGFQVTGTDGVNNTVGPSVQNIDFGVYWQFGTGVSKLAVNGAAPVTSTPPAQSTNVGQGVSNAILGWHLDSSTINIWDGVIKNVFIISGALSLSLQQKLEGWASWAEGLAGANLVTGHPYKLRAPFVSDS